MLSKKAGCYPPNSLARISGGIMAILTLDLGTTTGWAALTKDNKIQSGTALFKNGRYDGGGMRFLRFGQWLEDMRDLLPGLNTIYFEEVRAHRGVDAAHVYGGLLAVLTAYGEKHGIAYQGVPVGTIKKAATGNGNANKAAMIQAVQAKGFAPDDDNEADALAILLFCVPNSREGL